MKYCMGTDSHIQVNEVESKVWHDDDLYLLTCLKCGKKETTLARRPSDTLMSCPSQQLKEPKERTI